MTASAGNKDAKAVSSKFTHRRCCVGVIMPPAGYFISLHVAHGESWVWGSCSKWCKNFEGFTNPASATRTTLHKPQYGFTVFFPTMEVKPNFKYYSKYLRFLSMTTIEMKVS